MPILVIHVNAVTCTRQHRQGGGFLEVDQRAVPARRRKRLIGFEIAVHLDPVIAETGSGQYVKAILLIDIHIVELGDLVQRILLDADGSDLAALLADYVDQAQRAAVRYVQVFLTVDGDRPDLDKQPGVALTRLDLLEKQAVRAEYLDTVVTLIGHVVVTALDEHVVGFVETAR